jgi:very-short-patch-repair endonuclease
MRNQLAPDVAVARLAGAQHGIVTHRQLLESGLSPAAVNRRVSGGRLHRVHRGVYAVGHRAPNHAARWHAAVLAAGNAAVLSHRSAAELWKLLTPIGSTVHVTVAGRNGRARRPGIRIHRPRLFDDSLVAIVDRIPVTTIARTLSDLRGWVPPPVIRRAIRQAEFLGLLADDVETDHTRSDLERTFLRICRRHGLPMPEVNAVVGPFTVDFLWRDQRVIVEVDGYAAHRGRQAFRDDRDRDLELTTRGFSVHRVADTRIADDPDGVGALVARFLNGSPTHWGEK